jgi:hypothetical protein
VPDNVTGQGFDAAPEGGTNVKIGVGVLKKPAEPIRGFPTLEIVDGGTWTTRVRHNAVEFIHEVNDPVSGYGYRYRKIVSLPPGRTQLVLSHRLESTGRNPIDTEMSLLRQAVMSKLTYGQQPNLIGITYAAHDCIVDQVRNTAKSAANPSTSEYVIISGVQIHGALGHNFWWPGSITHFANGVETDLSGQYEKAISNYDLTRWINAKASEHAMASAGMRLPALVSDAVDAH